MEAVHVFLRVDALQNGLAVDVFGQRQLHQNAVHVRVGVQTVNQIQQFGFAGGGGQDMRKRFERCFFAGCLLVADIHSAGRVVAHQHYRQAGNAQSGRFALCHLFGDAGDTFFGNLLAIDDLSRHKFAF